MPPFFLSERSLPESRIFTSSLASPTRSFVRFARLIERQSKPTLLALLVFACLLLLGQAHLKLLWADELITVAVAAQPGSAGIWRALVAGADPNPPLTHLLVQASMHVLGSGALAVRLPAILSVLVTLALLWSILRRWVRPVFAAAGVLVFMATRGFDFGYDARSYAPLMVFSLATLALWVRLPGASGPRQMLLCAGLTLALAGAVSSNYYGVLAILPVAAGELARIYLSGRMRPGVWLAMALGMLPLYWYLPLIRSNLAEFGPYAWNRPQIGMVAASYLELVEAIFWPVLLLAGYTLYKRLRGACIPRPEFVAVAVLLAYPVLAYCFARAGSAMISPRCVAPVCCGFGLAAGVLSQRVFGRSAEAGLVVVLFLVAWVSVREAVCMQLLLNQRRAFLVLRDEVQRNAGGRIGLADSAFALPLFFFPLPAAPLPLKALSGSLPDRKYPSKEEKI